MDEKTCVDTLLISRSKETPICIFEMECHAISSERCTHKIIKCTANISSEIFCSNKYEMSINYQSVSCKIVSEFTILLYCFLTFRNFIISNFAIVKYYFIILFLLKYKYTM